MSVSSPERHSYIMQSVIHWQSVGYSGSYETPTQEHATQSKRKTIDRCKRQARGAPGTCETVMTNIMSHHHSTAAAWLKVNTSEPE